MAVESASDLAGLFSTDDFAETVTLNGSSISAIVEEREVEVMGDYALYKVLLVQASDLDGDPHGDPVVYQSTNYVILNVNLDGTGIAELALGPA